jgi:hypothetical protein
MKARYPQKLVRIQEVKRLYTLKVSLKLISLAFSQEKQDEMSHIGRDIFRSKPISDSPQLKFVVVLILFSLLKLVEEFKQLLPKALMSILGLSDS